MSHDHSQPLVIEQLLPEMDVLEQMCRRIETIVNEGGWDQKPVYYAFSVIQDPGTLSMLETVLDAGEERDLANPVAGALGVQEVPFPEPCYGDPATGMMGMLQALAELQNDDRATLVKFLDTLVPDNFYGFGLVSEAWTLPKSMPEEEAKVVSRERMMHVHPDRIELRNLFVATVDARVVSLVRHRGEFPTYHEYDPSQDWIDGRISTAVRLYTDLFDDFDTWRRACAAATTKSQG